jgi:hypothetical protein
MKKRNESWICYLKTDIGRQVLWVSLALSTASLLVASIALPLQRRPGGHIQGSEIKQLEKQKQAPSSNFIQNDQTHFLTFNSVTGPKGPDDAQNACAYYKAIGAIKPNVALNCNDVDPTDVNFLTPREGIALGITFNDWKNKNNLKINPDTNGNGNPFDDDDDEEVSALYFNAVDLALGRSMHGKTSLATSTVFPFINKVETTAYYVCNYDKETALEDAKNDPDNSNAVACVAFDHSEDVPFTKFYVFKQGNLVPSAKLDEDGEKFVPGLCKACHGGNNREPFPGLGDNPTNGNIGAYFLPFDLDNFDYLEDSAFSRRAQEGKFKRLNQMIPNPAPVVRELITGWYDMGRLDEQDSEFIPSGWMGNEQLYRRVVKPSCRTCHVAMRPGFDFATLAGFTLLARAGAGTTETPFGLIHGRVCANAQVTTPPDDVRLFRSMPNSAVTFDQFWLNRVARAVLVRFLRDALGDPSITCPPP